MRIDSTSTELSSEKAMQAAKTAKMANAFFSWEDMAKFNAQGFFPYTPATNLLYGLKEACDMLMDEGLDNVFARQSTKNRDAPGSVTERCGASPWSETW